jgi:DoxX-like protein
MDKFSWMPVLAWALVVFFVLGSSINILAPASVAAEYKRWGYPDWFHFVTGALELTAAALLAFSVTRWLGATLGCGVMLAAAATVIVHGEYTHAILPIIILALSAIVGWGVM